MSKLNDLDQQIVSQCVNGEREGFELLIDNYQSKVINISYGMLSNQEDAYDVSQEVFIKIYKSIDKFQGNSSLSTWIYRITMNMCKDFLRKRGRAVVYSLNDVIGDTDKERDIKDDSLTPEEVTEQNEVQQAVRDAINALKEEYKQVISLYDLEGLSYEEVAYSLDCPIGTVKSRLNRARAALRKKLSDKRELFM